MQAQQLLHYSFELRLAASLFMAVGLFAIVKLLSFIDEKITAYSRERQNTPTKKASHPVGYSVAVSAR